jgi:hypothetical protein
MESSARLTRKQFPQHFGSLGRGSGEPYWNELQFPVPGMHIGCQFLLGVPRRCYISRILDSGPRTGLRILDCFTPPCALRRKRDSTSEPGE